MAQHSHAGKPARISDLTNIPRLVSAYYLNKPDMSRPEQRVAFGTSGHRGSALHNAFTESHILAVTQALRSPPSPSWVPKQQCCCTFARISCALPWLGSSRWLTPLTAAIRTPEWAG